MRRVRGTLGAHRGAATPLAREAASIESKTFLREMHLCMVTTAAVYKTLKAILTHYFREGNYTKAPYNLAKVEATES